MVYFQSTWIIQSGFTSIKGQSGYYCSIHNPPFRVGCSRRQFLLFFLLSGIPPQPGPDFIWVASANCNSVENKMDSIRAFIASENVDILLIQESKLSGFVPSCDIGVQGFSSFRRDRNAKGGGLLTYVRNELHPTATAGVPNVPSELLAVDIHIGNDNDSVSILNMYCPPRNALGDKAAEFLDDLTTVIGGLGNQVVSAGDINVDFNSDISVSRSLKMFFRIWE